MIKDWVLRVVQITVGEQNQDFSGAVLDCELVTGTIVQVLEELCEPTNVMIFSSSEPPLALVVTSPVSQSSGLAPGVIELDTEESIPDLYRALAKSGSLLMMAASASNNMVWGRD